MSSRHLASLYFDGHGKAAAKRLRSLKRARLIAERPRLPQEPSILYLTRKGYLLLRDEGHLRGFPGLGGTTLQKRLNVSPLTLRHELDVMDVKAAMVKALRAHEHLSLVEFNTWPRLFQFPARVPGSGRKIWMRPDGWLRIHERLADESKVEHRLYLEVDRSTEALLVLRGKAACYLDHYRSGGMAARFDASRQEYKRFPFRTLWIFRTSERRNNAAQQLLLHRPPILTSAWLTTMAEFLDDPLGAIWLRPIDYRNVLLNGGRFASLAANRPSYRREIGREEMIDRTLKKSALWRGRAA